MNKHAKTALGIFLFFFFGFMALWAITENNSDQLKTLDDSIPLLSYFKPELFALVFMPLLVATGWRVWSGESHWSSVWFHSGVPLGLIASSISLIGVLQNVDNLEQARILTGESLLAVFYGGVASLVGYLNLYTVDIQIKNKRRSNISKFLVSLLAALPIAVGMDYYSGIMAFVDTPTVLIIAAVASVSLLVNRDGSKSICHLVCETMVIASLASVIIALVSYTTYQGYPRLIGPSIAIGILGPLYGSFVIFQCAIFLPETDLRETNFGRINWHLLEIYGFWILMCFAPLSLLEMF
jgi:hypothetical protein